MAWPLPTAQAVGASVRPIVWFLRAVPARAGRPGPEAVRGDRAQSPAAWPSPPRPRSRSGPGRASP
eukprot:10332506-Lingulodinium_polyedra.AAC.1